MMTVKLRIESTPAFVAQLVREGVTFTAEELDHGWCLITFTGGF